MKIEMAVWRTNNLMEENQKQTLVHNLRISSIIKIMKNKMIIKNNEKKKRLQEQNEEKKALKNSVQKKSLEARLFHNKWGNIGKIRRQKS